MKENNKKSLNNMFVFVCNKNAINEQVKVLIGECYVF